MPDPPQNADPRGERRHHAAKPAQGVVVPALGEEGQKKQATPKSEK